MSTISKIDELAALKLSIGMLEKRATKLSTFIKAALKKSGKPEVAGKMYKGVLIHQPTKTMTIAAHDQLRVLAIGSKCTAADTKFVPAVLSDYVKGQLARVSKEESAVLTSCKTLTHDGSGFLGVIGKPVTVFKSIRGNNGNTAIVELELPVGTKVIKVNGYAKMRASQAKVVDIKTKATGKKLNSGTSWHDGNFHYKVGATVKPRNSFNTNRGSLCESGIHCYADVSGARHHAS